MKFSLLVLGAPYQSQAAESALHFAQSVIDAEHQLYRVFFYQDGALIGHSMPVIPTDQPNITQAWQDFIQQQGVDAVVCVASALRRGVLSQQEADRHGKSHATIMSQFRVAGLGEWVDAQQQSDRVVVFGQ